MGTGNSVGNDYLMVLRRRKGPGLGVAGILLIAAGAVALSLPAVYRSTARLVMEQQNNIDGLTSTMVASYAEEQIRVLKKRVLTDSNLGGLIERLALYMPGKPAEHGDPPVERIRDNIVITPLNAKVTSSRAGGTAVISFAVSYYGQTPEIAYKVATGLTDLLLQQNVEGRNQGVGAASIQADNSSAEIEQASGDPASDQHSENLSEQAQKLMETHQQELMATQREIKALREQQIYVEAELARTQPIAPIYETDGKPPLSREEQLKSLESQYANMAAVSPPGHPELVKMREQIGALSKQAGGGSRIEALQQQLSTARAQLVAAHDRYPKQHGAVKTLERAVADLESQLQDASRTAMPQSMVTTDNPAYLQAQARHAAIAKDIRAVTEREHQLWNKLRRAQESIAETQEGDSIALGHDPEVVQPQDTQKKLQEDGLAEHSEHMEHSEKSSKGPRFSVVESAKLPQMTDKSNRLAILIAGVILALASGLGTVVVSEVLDGTVQGAKSVVGVLHTAPLAVIPYIPNKRDHRYKFVRLSLAIALLVGLVVGAAVFVHFEVAPLDVEWLRTVSRPAISQDIATH